MPIRGENVGRAYVTIYGDGSGLPDDIKDALNEAEPSVREAGDRHASTYDESFNARLRQSFKGSFGETQKDMFAGLNDSLTDSLARIELSDRFFGNKEWTKFRARLVNEFGDAGALAGDRLERRFRDSTNLEGLADSMKNIGPEVRKAQADLLDALANDEKKHNAEQEEEYARHLRRQQERIESHLNYIAERDEAYNIHWKMLADERDYVFDRDLKVQRDRIESHLDYIDSREEAYAENQQRRQREWSDTLTEAFNLNKSYDQQIDRLTRQRDYEFDRSVRKWDENLEVLRDGYANVLTSVRRLEKGVRESGLHRRTLIRDLEGLRHRLEPLDPNHSLINDFEMLERRVRVLHAGTTRLDRGFINLGDTLGTITGRGSRNNFLNFTGSLVRNFTNLLTLAPRLALKLGTTMYDGFVKAGGGLSGLVGAFAALGPLLGAAALGLAGVAVALGILFITLGPIVALFSGLLAIVAALASTIGFALVGSIAAVAGLLAPLAFGIGTVVFGLTNLSKVMKEDLRRDTRELRKEFSGLGEDIGKVLVDSAGEISSRLVPVLKSLRPLLLDIAEAASEVALDWADRLDSPGFRTFLDRIETFLPNAVEKLGDIFANTFGGFGGILTGMIPMLNRFLDWLDRITTTFNEWANSRAGQREIRQFFKDAGDSASALGGFLSDVWGLLRQIFDAGKGTGDSIFKMLGDQIEKFTKYLQENPDALKDWFDYGKDLAIEIGRLIRRIGNFLDKLDSSPTRKAVVGFIRLLDRIGNKAIWVSEQLQMIESIRWNKIIREEAAKRTSKAASDGVISNIIKITAVTQKMPGLMRGIMSRLPSIFAEVGGRLPPPLLRASTSIINFFQSVPRRIEGMISALPGIFGIVGGQMVSAIQNVPERIIGFFVGLGGRIASAIGDINIPMPNIPDIPGLPDPFASGGVIRSRTFAMMGEDGAEAVVPLARDLSQVDPAVRWLSAIAQGKMMPGMGMGTSKTIDASGWTIVSPTEDPRAVANEVVNTLVASAYSG